MPNDAKHDQLLMKHNLEKRRNKARPGGWIRDVIEKLGNTSDFRYSPFVLEYNINR